MISLQLANKCCLLFIKMLGRLLMAKEEHAH